MLDRTGALGRAWGGTRSLEKDRATHSPPSCFATTAATAATSPTAVGPLCFPRFNKGLRDACQQAEPPELWGSGRTKQRERRVLTGQRLPAFRAIKRQGPRESGTTRRPRLCIESWVSKVLRDARALSSFLLPTHAQEGTSFSCRLVRAS